MSASCCVCSQPKATTLCRECSGHACKSCTEFVDVNRFSFFAPPANKEHAGSYCLTCYQAKVAPVAEQYDSLMAQAEDVSVYFIEQSKETRLIKRTEKKLRITDCADRDETIMRLAFRAVEGGFNTLVDTDLVYEKHREGSFKIAHWSGTAMPAKLEDRSRPRESKLKSPSR